MLGHDSLDIRKAKPGEAGLLTDLSRRSKAYWGYSENYLEKCKPALTVSVEDIEKALTYLVEHKNKVIGFYMLKELEGDKRLNDLWLEPDYIGKGLGAFLFQDAVNRAIEQSWSSFRIVADPKACGFYFKMGAEKLGEVQSRKSQEVYLPYLEYKFKI